MSCRWETTSSVSTEMIMVSAAATTRAITRITPRRLKLFFDKVIANPLQVMPRFPGPIRARCVHCANTRVEAESACFPSQRVETPPQFDRYPQGESGVTIDRCDRPLAFQACCPAKGRGHGCHLSFSE